MIYTVMKLIELKKWSFELKKSSFRTPIFAIFVGSDKFLAFESKFEEL